MAAKPTPRKKKARLSVTVPPAIRAKAQRMAKERGVTVSRLLELLVIEEKGRIDAGHPTDLNSPELVAELRRLGVFRQEKKEPGTRTSLERRR
jgi:hypothetical protein